MKAYVGAALATFVIGVVAGCGSEDSSQSNTYSIETTVPGVGVGGLSGSGTRTGTVTAYGVRQRSVVLGSRISFGPHGRGWGTPHPASVDNDGDPSGKAWRLRWVGWGSAVARGSGLTYVLGLAQGTGYSLDRLQFRASRIGHCTADGPDAYTRLEVRVAKLHRGPFTAWQLWNGRPNVCRAS